MGQACLVSRVRNNVAIVASATAPDSRSDDEPMLIHCEEERQRRWCRSAATLRAGGGCQAISSSLVVVMNEHQLLLAPGPCPATPTGDSHVISDSGHYSPTKLLFFLLLIRLDVLGVHYVIRLSAGRSAGTVTGWPSLAAAGLRT